MRGLRYQSPSSSKSARAQVSDCFLLAASKISSYQEMHQNNDYLRTTATDFISNFRRSFCDSSFQ